MSNTELSQELTDQRECDREAIHLFASIQGHGFLLAFTWPDQRIQIISENAGEYVGVGNKEVLGARLEHYFPKSFIEAMSASIESFPWESKGRHLDIRPELKGKMYDVFLFESDGLFVLELEPYKVTEQNGDAEVRNERTVRDFLLQSKNAKNLEDLSQLACMTIRRITGLDRVMMYRFLPPNWHGEVIAEDRIASAHSYMGHRFPASDIPRPARELYLRNQVRLIPDSKGRVVPLTPAMNPRTKKVIDLSDSRLRSVAKVHMEYLNNMGVGASFSVSVIDGGELWGLIACHHMTPMHISQSQRTACEIIAQIFSIQAPLTETLAAQNRRLDFELRLKKILESLRLTSNPLDYFFKQHRTVTETFQAGGLALVGAELNDFAGLTPLKADIEQLAPWVQERMQHEGKNVIAIDNLPSVDPRWAHLGEYATGVLAVAIPEMQNALLLLFRPELVRTVIWGGDPRKQLEKRGFQGQLNPRASFEAWEEVIKGKSEPWSRFEVDGMLFLRDIVFEGLIKKEQLIRDLSRRKN